PRTSPPSPRPLNKPPKARRGRTVRLRNRRAWPRTSRISSANSASDSRGRMSAEYQLCTLYVDTMFCGIDVNKVQEALSPQPLTRVPLASRVVRGLVNLRGQIIAAIDLR